MYRPDRLLTFGIGMDRLELRRSRCKLFVQSQEKFGKRWLYSALTCLNLENVQIETIKYYFFLKTYFVFQGFPLLCLVR